ncbi:MAG: FAD-dependent oxidoreductase [Anaerolineaceae bacterium]|nr:FAD-dependent oxidoreductase [Anaerolineaceae bacterium]
MTIAGVEDTYDSPPLPDFLDISHFPTFDMHDPRCQNYMTEMVEAMHAVGTIVSGSLFSANRVFRYENEKGEVEAVSAASPTADTSTIFNGNISDDIPAENLYKIIKSYGQRTALYRKLGFDAVTVHMSYRTQFPSQLLSPLTNFRTDEFGGSFENRARFPLLMLEEIRKAGGDDLIIEIQFSGEEPEGGYTFEEGIEFLKLAQKYVDIVVRSAEGDPNHPIPFELNPTPFLEMAAKVKVQGLDFLVSNVGGYFDPDIADQAIREGKVDLVAMARAWISNPDYGDIIAEGRKEDLVPCLRCNKCHGRGKRDIFTTTCSVNPLFGFEEVSPYLGKEAEKKKKVAVIGGGPGGMRTAIYLADRGHEVTIYEAESELGGAIRHADYVPFKWTLKEYKDYLIRQVEKRKIKVYLNTRATPETLGDEYDTVVAAIGASPVIPKIPGADLDHVTVATDALMHSDKIGKNVVIIGGGEVGVETGMFLAQKGRNVTVIEMRDELAADSTATHYRSMFEEAWKAIDNFHYVLNASAKQISKDHVTYTDKDGNDHDLPADSVILSVGMRSKSEEALSFYGKGREFWMVGDCKKPGTIQTTNRSAYGAAVNI